jgi:hypothetical protein
MDQRKIGRLTLFYDPAESAAADIVEEACRRSLDVIGETWGLEAPQDCRVYVMTSWTRFVFDSSPWQMRPILAVTSPLWLFRVRRLWPHAGGWTQRYGRRQAVGVKPPRLLQASDRSIGERIFVREDDVTEKIRHVTCHELTHAFTAHLRLPSWLNEGLAMVTVERFCGRATVREDTLDALDRQPAPRRPAQFVRLNPADEAAVVRHYVRGYWIARLLAEINLQAMRELLRARRSQKELERRIAAILGTSPNDLWREADRIALSYFRQARLRPPA